MRQSGPAVTVCLSSGFENEKVLREALRGLEEESVPWQLERGEGEAVSLAFFAAGKSALEVGIGIDEAGLLAVHYRKLPADEPYFKIDYEDAFGKVRLACANAARLVKNTPFIKVD